LKLNAPYVNGKKSRFSSFDSWEPQIDTLDMAEKKPFLHICLLEKSFGMGYALVNAGAASCR